MKSKLRKADGQKVDIEATAVVTKGKTQKQKDAAVKAQFEANLAKQEPDKKPAPIK